MARARLSSKAQIVLPAGLRRELAIEPGDELLVEREDDRIVVRKPGPGSWVGRLESFCGDHWSGLAEEVQRERALWDRRG